MQTERLGQAAIFIFIMIVATSCAATKEYTSKLFTPRIPVAKDSQAVALKFLDIEHTEKADGNWVNTDVFLGRDSLNKALALDKLSETIPANNTTKKSDSTKQVDKSTPVLVTKPVPGENEPVARYLNQGDIRTKRTRE